MRDDTITGVRGNIIDVVEGGGYDYVLHVCNCQNRMGAGVAKAIATAWPEAMAVDMATKRGDSAKLGEFSSAVIERNGHIFTVINLYGQFRYGPAYQQHFQLTAFDHAVKSFAASIGPEPKNIVFPLMGAGNGGGRWRHARYVLLRHLDVVGHKLTLVQLDE